MRARSIASRAAWIVRALVLSTCLATAARAQGVPALMLDINSREADRSFLFESLGVVGDAALLSARDEEHGIELWRSDGTDGGTFLVADLRPGSASSLPRMGASIGSAVLFVAHDDVYGETLWRTDGTPEGTSIVTERALWDDGKSPRRVTAIEGLVYVLVEDFSFDRSPEIWRSDGTDHGTTLVVPATEPSEADFTAFGGKVFFRSARDGRRGELFVADGSAAGVRPLADHRPDLDGLSAFGLTRTTRGVFFWTHEAGDAASLWRTDGTALGTRRLGPPRDPCGAISEVGDRVIFVTREEGGCHLRAIDGADGETAVATIPDDSASVLVQAPILPVEGRWIVPIWDGDERLYGSDGTDEGTAELLGTNACQNGIREMMPFRDAVVFVASTSGDGWELWRTDGTAPGTRTMAPHVPGVEGSRPLGLTVLGDRLLFGATDGRNGHELWVTDGTDDGTRMLRDLSPRHTGRGVGRIRSVEGTIYLQTTQSLQARTSAGSLQEPVLWRTDGRWNGTGPVDWAGVNPWTDVPLAADATRTFFFGRSSRRADLSLWVTGGTAETTRLLAEEIGPDVTGTARAVLVGTRLFVTWWDGTIVSDGTAAGTKRLPIEALDDDSIGPRLTKLGDDVVLFAGRRSRSSRTLWRSDGTVAGTIEVSEYVVPLPLANLRPDDGWPVLDGVAFVLAQDGLWRTDGTAVGTWRVYESVAAPTGSHDAIAWRGEIYFTGGDATTGLELWRTTGGGRAAEPVKDLLPGGASSQPTSFAAGVDTLYFSASDADHGEELWATDGTGAGTRLVSDLRPGAESSTPERFFVVGDEVYFTADDGVHGRELWLSDGTAAGTVLVGDLNPGPSGSGIRDLTMSPRGIVFSAIDGQTGPELWILTCGNGFVEDGEQCDDGTASLGGSADCSASCRGGPGGGAGGWALGIDHVRLVRAKSKAPARDRVLVRGGVGGLTPLEALRGLDLRVRIDDGPGFDVALEALECRLRGRSVRCRDRETGAVVKLQRRGDPAFARSRLRLQLGKVSLPSAVSEVSVALGRPGHVRGEWTSSICVLRSDGLLCR